MTPRMARTVLLFATAVAVVLAAPMRVEFDANNIMANHTDRASVQLQLSPSAKPQTKASTMVATNSTVINGTEHLSVADLSPSEALAVVVAAVATSAVDTTVLDMPSSQTPLLAVVDTNNPLVDTGHGSVLDSPPQTTLVALDADTDKSSVLDGTSNQTPLVASLETDTTRTTDPSSSDPSPTASTRASATLIFFFVRIGRPRHVDDAINTPGGQSSAAIPSATPDVIDGSGDPDKVSPPVIRALVAVFLIASAAYAALYSFWKWKRPPQPAPPSTRLPHRRVPSVDVAILGSYSPGPPSPTDTMLTLVNANTPPKEADVSTTDATVSNDVEMAPILAPQWPPAVHPAGRGGRGRNALAEAHASHF
ncbi:hypothetical protein B0H16DRAFT_266634 [Mycena metata]|uniref:Mid2 domain-containing protein n=1 Tax=Mycena metata TaxID=1033252 RepID=A0AAD7HSS1_9AGAR|nr:hypothetical protein B0H16DRAFT_266634 [Mycena metata]